MATIGNADDEHNFVKEWSKWAENNTKKGRVSSLSSDGQHSGGGVEEQSLCPICIDEMQKEEEILRYQPHSINRMSKGKIEVTAARNHPEATVTYA
ncbi:hypothetical protein Pmar_PMAR020878 [Perkinsus marinus ATCC 50983]|uniref:Uncharacterized protein n=1 Tax=Perkinsus marinus (strain ATCC 50983 / TXsc) TaxID=423536 RepID=C5KN61_PERM5|nr:hypothetical protein Pmar_PMAR020878 [Perkinsus marinus ATCC 50983]EER14095.1 hypothetical protein Pmar_PMAR020878 [Perkinsus marinus ATCC 50983]|eukprot:XP_002782300.1 hypothetical protein Pmar_PMAR020878 [Perkinsus marinus ATCC 50983]